MVQVKNFFVNYRRRFNIDEVLQEWEAEHGKEETNGPSNQRPVKSPENPLKMPDEEDEVTREVSALCSPSSLGALSARERRGGFSCDSHSTCLLL